MVLAKKAIPGTSQNDGVLGSFNKDTVLAGARQVTLNGALSQILQLAAYSNELFSGLMQETNNIHTRIVNISRRLNNVSSTLPQLDEFFKNTSYEALHIQLKAEYHVPSLERSGLLVPDTKPPSLLEVHLKTIPPPNLALLDPYNDPPGASCLKLYSNPGFFIDEWMAEMERQRAVALEKRKERKKERDQIRAKAGLTKKATGDVRVEAKAVTRQRFDPHTGQKIIETGPGVSPRPESPAPARVDAAPLGSTSSPHLRPQPPVPQPQAQAQKPAPLRSSSSTSFPAPAQPALNGQPAFQQAAPSYATMRTGVLKQHGRVGSAPSAGDYEAPPPAPVYAPPPIAAPPPAAPSPYANNQAYANPQAYTNQAYSTPTYAAPPVAPAAPAPNAPKPPPLNMPKPPPNAPAPPPPPTPTGSSSPAIGGGLAAALAEKGQSLRATEEVKKPANAQSDLLQQIRSGISLKTAQNQIEEKKKEQAPADNSVASILARRIAIADSDDEEEEEDDEEWSD